MCFSKKLKLERQLMEEIKSYAGVYEFPNDDAKEISKLLAAYNKGNGYLALAIMAGMDTLEKYPDLCNNWDELMIQYKKLGLFPKWKTNIDE